MSKFGKLASEPEFKAALQLAKANPDSPDSVRLNAVLLRLLSLVGGCVPFSAFERAATRPKLGAMRYRYGVAQHFLTIAPPEHDDLLLHRIAELRESNGLNDATYPCVKRQCCFDDLPDAVRSSSDARQAVARRYPALSAQVFERQMASLTRDILRCQDTNVTRMSRNYLERQCGVYGRVAAFNAVIEPQSSGRLHTHLTIYGASINPGILTRLASSPELWPSARKWFKAVSTTHISEQTRVWCEEWRKTHGQKRARTYDIDVPDAGADYDGFLLAAEKRAVVTNLHSHSHTCRKGVRGRYLCRLARPAGLHEDTTMPLQVRLTQASNLGKRQRAIFDVKCIDGPLSAEMDRPRHYANKRVTRPHLDGAVVWEQTRPAEDAIFVETNLPLACLTGAHTNSAIINGKDAGDMVEEYQQAYMTKEKGGLKCATTVMLTALNDIEQHPSVADDQGTSMRSAKHLATRTVNAFTGGNEWPHALMVYALAGHRSFQSSDTFWYVFPHKLMHEMKAPLPSSDGTHDQQEGDPSSGEESEVEDECDVGDVNSRLESIVAVANDDCTNQQSRGSSYSSGGARMFKVGDEIVLVTQARSYRHRGEWFRDYSALEFEVIVDILPRCDDPQPEQVSRGRPKRRGFDLSSSHPLAPHFQGFIRAKFKTAMLGGPPPPSVPKDGKPSTALSKYILCLFYPWTSSEGLLPFQPSPKNLVRICREWDSTEASFVNAQRFRVIDNVLQKHHRSSTNERVCSEWRSRNADFWNEASPVIPNPTPPCVEDQGSPISDPEAMGLVSLEDRELYSLAKAASAKDQRSIDSIRALRATFFALIPLMASMATREGRPTSTVYQDHIRGNFQLSKVARSIHTMAPPTPPSGANNQESSPTAGGQAFGNSIDPHQGSVDDASRKECSTDQQKVFDRIVGAIDDNMKLGQTLTVLHGGGGTGKSTLIRRITSALRSYGIDTVSTCPTGVGASNLDSGRTVHSAFKILRKTELSDNDLELMRLTFTERVWLIVVDEVSMLSAEHLALIDSRLRAIYRTNLTFGGRSVILAGDFLQLDVTSGKALCKMMYETVKSPMILTARALFREFKVFFLTQQHRAAGCDIQKANLLACRSLPSFYPSGSRYTMDEMRVFRPITRSIAQTIAKEVTMNDIKADPDWIDEMTIFGHKQHRQGCVDSTLIYDEDAHPELFAYFARGVKAQILDNNSGNVGWCIANGSACKMHSLAWEDPVKTDLVVQMVREARKNRTGQVDLPFPPDYINVQLVEPTGEPMSGEHWPVENNLDSEWEMSAEGVPRHKQTVVIPIGVMSSKSRKKCIRIGQNVLEEAIDVEIIQHAVDVSIVMTVWKAQGSTLKRVILDLEPTRTSAPKWGFEHIYVGISRVTAANCLRCLPLTGAFRLSSLQNLRPSIYTTKWRLDNVTNT